MSISLEKSLFVSSFGHCLESVHVSHTDTIMSSFDSFDQSSMLSQPISLFACVPVFSPSALIGTRSLSSSIYVSKSVTSYVPSPSLPTNNLLILILWSQGLKLVL